MFVDDDGVGLAGGKVDGADKEGDLVVGVQVGPQLLGPALGVGGADDHLAGFTLEGGQGVQILLVGVDEVAKDGSYCLSILKSADGDPSCNHRFFYEYDAPIAGTAHFIHTYQENLDPLPPFEGEPRKIAIGDVDAKSWADEIWANLNPDNKVSLFVQVIDLATGERDTVIINKHN